MNQKCTNCDSTLTGPYCSNCGQSERTRRATVAHMLAEASEDMLRFDSKFYVSIVHLLFKPGSLSRQFISGKRVSILPPVRMYLVISLIFFVIFDIPAPDVKENNVYIGGTLIGKEEHEPGKINFTLFSFNRDGSDFEKRLGSFLDEKLEPLKDTDPQLVIDRLFNQLEDLVPNLLILFMPIFALLLKIIYFFRRVLYFDHLIFSLHFQSWLMVMIMIIYGLAQYNLWWTSLSIVLPIYLAKAQKEVYNQTYWLVIPKTFLLIFMYLFMLAFATLIAMLAAIALM